NPQLSPRQCVAFTPNRGMLERIISGGQTGADQGGLRAAKKLGIATGGWAPKGWATEDGSAEKLLRSFGLKEYPKPGYPPRTRATVLDADATVIFGQDTSGSQLTARECERAGKPYLWIGYPPSTKVPPPSELAAWLVEHKIKTLRWQSESGLLGI